MPTVAERATPFHAMPFGAELGPDGAVRFRLWAPEQQRVRLVLEGQDETLAMQPRSDGWHELATSGARAGTQYCFELANGMRELKAAAVARIAVGNDGRANGHAHRSRDRQVLALREDAGIGNCIRR